MTRAVSPAGQAPLRSEPEPASASFVKGLALISSAALVVRVVAAATNPHQKSFLGDAVYYSIQAKQLTQGHWFQDPFLLAIAHRSVPSAAHPPLFSSYLAIFASVGFDSAASQRMITCITGTLTVGLVGLIGRRLAGARAGLIAAALAAIYPSLWVTERQGLSEGLAAVVTAGLLLAADRWWTTPTMRRACLLGLVMGLLALSRSEYIILFALLPALTVGFHRGLSRRSKLLAFTAILSAGLLVIAPWVAYNTTRFHQPTIMTTNLGATLAAAYCDEMFYGPYRGSWSGTCITEAGRATLPPRPADEDESDGDKRLGAYARRYARDHLSDVPSVMLARVGRLFQVYRTSSAVSVDAFVGMGSVRLARIVMWSSWVVSFFAPIGAVFALRRRLRVLPAILVVVATMITAAMVYGSQRFRVPADPALLLMAAIGIDGLWRFVGGRHLVSGRKP